MLSFFVLGRYMVEAKLQALHPKKKRFLEHYKKLFTISRACEATGITRTTYYRWMDDCPSFKTSFEQARQRTTELLEAEAIRRAYEGVEQPIIRNGFTVGVTKEYSDTLLIFLLKAADPTKYREHIESHVDVTTKGEKIVGNRDIPAASLADTIAILERSRIPALAGNQN